MSAVPIEKEFFVLKIDAVNELSRIYSEDLVNKWIENLKNNQLGYKIEYSVDLNVNNLKTEFIKDSLHCGMVTELKIVKKLNEKHLIAKAKFKVKGPHVEKMHEPNFFDSLTLVPKGSGKVWDNKIFDYNLIGFNLIPLELSPFFTENL